MLSLLSNALSKAFEPKYKRIERSFSPFQFHKNDNWYAYSRTFETPDRLLPNTWIVIRLDGRSFHALSAHYGFIKPNDERALRLANEAARGVLEELPDLVLAYGQSDEFSFVMHPKSNLYGRRNSKLVSSVVSIFTAYYVTSWSEIFPDKPLGRVPDRRTGWPRTTGALPTFDGRAVVYPTRQNLRDYLSWRHVDCHINNLYNTTFWALVQKGGMSNRDAEKELLGTYAADKNEILFSRFGINYNNEPEIFRRGSVIFRDYPTSNPETPDNTTALARATKAKAKLPTESTNADMASWTQGLGPQEGPAVEDEDNLGEKGKRAKLKKSILTVQHTDIIGDGFWRERPWLLGEE